MPRRQSKFLFACARLARQTTHRNPKTDSTLRFRPLAGAERMREELGAYAGGAAGHVRVLSNTNALTEFLPEVLGRFLAEHPQVTVDLQERLSDEIVGLVAEGVSELGIVAATADTGALETYPFRTDRFVLVVPGKHPLATRDRILFTDVLDLELVARHGDYDSLAVTG